MKKFKNQEKLKKAVYSVCALCLCGVLLLSYVIYEKDDISPAEETTLADITHTEKEIEANSPANNVPDTRDDPVTTTEADRSVHYYFPLGSSFSKAFSHDEIVKNNTTGDWRTHNGADIEGSLGDRVNAIADGTVTALENDVLWGICITIDHNNGITAKYCGLEKGSTVKPGDEVKAQDKIGALGEIPVEKADGTHLHLEIFKGDERVSPSEYLGKDVEL